ncbi:hypothetical protein [Marinobacter sp.]|uniref:hypothetical protein n=1 Tax=Marinobacter sp. TaxID=50741 RepID=UPI003A8E6CED
MKLKTVSIMIFSITLLSGCGIIEKKVATEETLQEKASLAIGVEPKTINISNVKSGLEKVTFDAESNNSKYSCYYTTVIMVKSDAICKKMEINKDKEPSKIEKSDQCNALLEAAGKC